MGRMIKKCVTVTTCVVTASVISLVVATPAYAREIRTGGSKTCPSGQQVIIFSRASGAVTHSWSRGPEHAGYPIYRNRASQSPMTVGGVSRTTLQNIYQWQVTADDSHGWRGVIVDAYAECDTS
jgi:hypothetical protein